MRAMLRNLMIAMAGAACACAQNSDVGLLLGVSFPTTEVVGGTNARVSASAGASGQINYAWQVLSARAGDLYIELPFVVTGHTSANITRSVTALDNGGVFLVPGVRFKVHL